MMFAALAVTLSVSTWGLTYAVSEIVTVVALLAMLVGAAVDARLGKIVLPGALSVAYLAVWLVTAYIVTPDELNLPAIGPTVGVNYTQNFYATAYVVAAGVFAVRRGTREGARPF